MLKKVFKAFTGLLISAPIIVASACGTPLIVDDGPERRCVGGWALFEGGIGTPNELQTETVFARNWYACCAKLEITHGIARSWMQTWYCECKCEPGGRPKKIYFNDDPTIKVSSTATDGSSGTVTKSCESKEACELPPLDEYCTVAASDNIFQTCAKESCCNNYAQCVNDITCTCLVVCFNEGNSQEACVNSCGANDISFETADCLNTNCGAPSAVAPHIGQDACEGELCGLGRIPSVE